MALWAVIRNAPAPAPVTASRVASQRTRSVPVPLVNDSVCRFPWPDHEPSACQATVVCPGVAAWSARARHEAATSARHARMAHRAITGRLPGVDRTGPRRPNRSATTPASIRLKALALDVTRRYPQGSGPHDAHLRWLKRSDAAIAVCRFRSMFVFVPNAARSSDSLRLKSKPMPPVWFHLPTV